VAQRGSAAEDGQHAVADFAEHSGAKAERNAGQLKCAGQGARQGCGLWKLRA